MSSLGTPALAVLFAVGGVATWVAGIYLSKTTDVLDDRLHLGDAIGGLVLLAVAGSLPEVAITASAAASGALDLASGNLIGGIAVQTLVLAVCDATVRGDRPLTSLVSTLMPVLEAVLVILVVSITVAGGLLPESTAIGGVVSPASIGIVVVWVGGLLLLNRVRRAGTWRLAHPASTSGARVRRRRSEARASTARVLFVFGVASLVTLAAGVALAESGNELADRWGIGGVVFGATILAAVTALPEVSTGIAAVRLGDFELVLSDIFGGNAFQVCLFLLADLVAWSPVLAHEGNANAWLGQAGVVLTAVYAGGLVIRPGRRRARLGADSILALVLYAFAIAGLVAITR